MSRVLIISGDFPPIRSGEANLAFFLAQRLAERGIDVDVLSVQGSEESDRFRVHGLMKNWNWREANHLRSLIKQIRPDAVLLAYHRGMYHGHPMISFAATLAKSIDPSIHFMTQVSQVNFSTKRSPSITTRLARRAAEMWAGSARNDYVYGTLLRDSDSVMVLSQAHAEYLAKIDEQVVSKTLLIPPPPILRIADDADAARREARAELGLQQDEFAIAFYGFIYRNKGLQHLLQAVASLRDEGRRLRLVVIGGVLRFEHLPERTTESEAYFQNLQSQCQELGLEDLVHWEGTTAIDCERPSRLLYASDMAVFPFDEGVRLNNSSFAAAAVHRLPIVATRSQATEDAFQHEQNVLLCAPSDSEELARSIKRVMKDEVLRDKLRDGIHAMVQRWFSWDRAVDQIANTLLPDAADRPQDYAELSA
ncbi:MAG: glycosyltransferase family 4 protein [Planctomycetales bacterium]|nr:glycosyltransferase family 4 protein [Planctomycetales bacterium]